MPSQNIIQPKQQRSKDTQTKLLDALHFWLEQKFFEHITIKELAEHAGVSVGTFYRRFKDKESLLPLLYQDFGRDLQLWVEDLEQQQFDSLGHALEEICTQAYDFLQSKKSVFRTLHLNSRLQSTLLKSDKNVDRRLVYEQISNVVLRFSDEMTVADKSNAASTFVFMMITCLMEKVLYPELTPAIACEADGEAFSKQLPEIFIPYFISK